MSTARSRRRRGATLVLTAVMMTALLGFVALAADTMVLAVAKHQLGIASDAGALAGAAALADDRRLMPNADLNVIFASAHDRARHFAQANPVLGQAPVILANAANVGDGDVVLGYIADPRDPASPFLTAAAQRPNFNSVRIRAARTASRGGLVPAFFSRAMGFEGSDVSVPATASAMAFDIAGFRSDAGANADLLPIVLDKTTYDAMLGPAGSTIDAYRFDPATGLVSAGADGVRESQLYPVKNGYPGNWGTVKIGVSNNSTSVLGAQIRNGVTPQQLATYPGGRLALGQTDANGKKFAMLQGNPGISSGIKDDLEAIIGKARTIPVYDPAGSGGNGNNAQYKVVGFAPIRILSVNFQGNPKYVIVQPATTRDPTAIPGAMRAGWSAGGLIRLNLSR